MERTTPKNAMNTGECSRDGRVKNGGERMNEMKSSAQFQEGI